jgi:predicted ester cyclase
VTDPVDRFLDAWNGRVQAAFARACTDDLHYEDPFAGEPLAGPAALGAHAARLWEAFPDARVEESGERLRGGAYAAIPVKVLGTNTGELDGLPPTKRFVVVHAIVYAELRGSRLFRVRAFCDRYDAAVQLGLLPRPGTLGDKALLALRGFGLAPRR